MSAVTKEDLEKRLEKIRRLSVEQKKEKNAERASILQAEIFRKFEIIDSFRYLAIDRHLPWSRELDQLVWKCRTEVDAEEEDFDWMEIPNPHPGNGNGRNVKEEGIIEGNGGVKEEEEQKRDFFPYAELPSEVREMILKNLSSPTDKMNIYKVKREDFLMIWDVDTVQFELKIIKQMETRFLSWLQLIDLCNESPSYFDVIRTHFEGTLDKFDEFCVQTNLFTLNDKLKLVGTSTMNPIPVQVELFFRYPWEEEVPSALHILEEIGKGIWDCLIWIVGPSLDEISQFLCDALSRMPNLRRLNLRTHSYFTYFELRRDVNGQLPQQDLNLPDLPHLKHLHLFGPEYAMIRNPVMRSHLDSGITRHRDILWATFLKKYGVGLCSLKIYPFPKSPAFHSGITGMTAPQLSKLEVGWGCGSKLGSCVLISFLESLKGFPLHRIQIKNIPQANLLDILAACSQSFGGCLEELDISIDNFPKPCLEPFETVWLGWREFKRLKILQLSNYHGFWNFLLQLPALQYLELTNSRIVDGISFQPLVSSQHLKKQNEWKIWKLLPFLERIVFRNGREELAQNENFVEFTRAECVVAEKELVSNSRPVRVVKKMKLRRFPKKRKCCETCH